MIRSRELEGMVNVAATLPETGKAFYQQIKDFESKARGKYPQLAFRIDERYELERKTFLNNPSEETLLRLRQAIGNLGAFNFVEGLVPIVRRGQILKEAFSRAKLGPGSAVQILETSALRPQDRVLELFSGLGYFSFFLSLRHPQALDSVDLFSGDVYDLDETFSRAYRDIFSAIPGELRPEVTNPRFVKADCTALPPFGQGELGDYDVVFIHPPFGRESAKIVSLSEEEAFELWVNT